MKALSRFFYRGAHRAKQFSIRVADIKDRLDQEPVGKIGAWTVLGDGTRVIPNLPIRFPSAPEAERGVVMLAPPGGVSSFPALVGDD